MRRIVVRTALALSSIGVSLLVVEGGIHAVEAMRGPMFPGGTRTLSFTRPDSALGWRHVEDFSQRYGWPEHPDGYVLIATNNLGLREDSATSLAPDDGVTRILALGDSHTDGLLHNRESWPNVVEHTETPELRNIEVLNAGVTGYQPSQYLRWWQTRGRAMEPEVVVLGYYVGNDLITGVADSSAAEEEGTAAESDRTDEQDPSLTQAVFRAIRHRCRLCALASLVSHRLWLDGPTYEETMFVRGDDPGEVSRYVSALRHCIGCLWQSVEQQWRAHDTPGLYETELRATEQLLRELRDDVVASGASLLLVLIPTKLQIEDAARARATETASILGVPDYGRSFEDTFEADVEGIAESLGIGTVPIRHLLEAEHRATGRPMYYDADWHLNVHGSRIVGRAVAEALSRTLDFREP